MIISAGGGNTLRKLLRLIFKSATLRCGLIDACRDVFLSEKRAEHEIVA
jgi:hypothetical protein